jgi:hypothetical protein
MTPKTIPDPDNDKAQLNLAFTAHLALPVYIIGQE